LIHTASDLMLQAPVCQSIPTTMKVDAGTVCGPLRSMVQSVYNHEHGTYLTLKSDGPANPDDPIHWVIVVDASKSMDTVEHGSTLSRMGIAKAAVETVGEYLEELKRPHDIATLIVFGSVAKYVFKCVPITANLFEKFEIPLVTSERLATNAESAVNLAVSSVHNNPACFPVTMFFTDGEFNNGVTDLENRFGTFLRRSYFYGGMIGNTNKRNIELMRKGCLWGETENVPLNDIEKLASSMVANCAIVVESHFLTVNGISSLINHEKLAVVKLQKQKSATITHGKIATTSETMVLEPTENGVFNMFMKASDNAEHNGFDGDIAPYKLVLDSVEMPVDERQLYASILKQMVESVTLPTNVPPLCRMQSETSYVSRNRGAAYNLCRNRTGHFSN
jgi:hypothetical protein